MLGLDHLRHLLSGEQAQLLAAGRQVLGGLRPFPLRIDDATGTYAAVGWEVHEGGVIREIRSRLRAALPRLADRRPDPYRRDGRDTFRPHLSVAYCTAATDNRPVVDTLRRFHPSPVAEVTVRAIDLVRVPAMSFDQQRIATFALRGDSSAGARAGGAAAPRQA